MRSARSLKRNHRCSCSSQSSRLPWSRAKVAAGGFMDAAAFTARIGTVLTAALLALVAITDAYAAPPAPPTLVTPNAVRVLARSYLGAETSFSVSATDWRGRSLDVSCSPRSGSLFPLGRTVVACSATDRRELTTTRTFPVTATMLWAPRAGASETAPPVLRWAPITGATYYNVQLYRGTTKVLSAWPRRPRLALRDRWTFGDRTYRLRARTYRWYVWPHVEGGYGRTLGSSTFSARLS